MSNFIENFEGYFKEIIRRQNDLEQIIQNQQANQLLNVNEVSKITGFAKQTIYQKVCNKSIPFYKIGRSTRFRRSEIMNWIENKENKLKINFINKGGN